MRKLCPDNETLMDFTEGRLSERRRAEIEVHLAACDKCREQVGVCAELLFGGVLDETVPVSDRITQKIVDRMIRPQASTPQPRIMHRPLNWVHKGMAILEHWVSGGEPVPAAVRGGTVAAENLIRRRKRFGNMDVSIEIERSGDAQALIRVAWAKQNQTVSPVRVTLSKGDREIASMLLAEKPVVFEEIAFGAYSLVFVRGKKIGEYAFEITEQSPNGL